MNGRYFYLSSVGNDGCSIKRNLIDYGTKKDKKNKFYYNIFTIVIMLFM